jgi:hypothetical protein
LGNEISPTQLKRVKSDFALETFQSFQQRFFKKIYRENFPVKKAEPNWKNHRLEFSLQIAFFGISIVFWEQHMVASNLMWDNCSLLY